jgi:hypothetical protein
LLKPLKEFDNGTNREDVIDGDGEPEQLESSDYEEEKAKKGEDDKLKGNEDVHEPTWKKKIAIRKQTTSSKGK